MLQECSGRQKSSLRDILILMHTSYDAGKKGQYNSVSRLQRWIKCLLYKQDDLNLDPQHPHKPGTVMLKSNSSTGVQGGQRQGGSLKLAGHPVYWICELQVQWETLCKQTRWRVIEKTEGVYFWSPHACAQPCIHVRIHVLHMQDESITIKWLTRYLAISMVLL